MNCCFYWLQTSLITKMPILANAKHLDSIVYVSMQCIYINVLHY
jgi:hypothetical protein